MRAAGQRVGDINKPEAKVIKTPTTDVELAKNIKHSTGGKNVYILDIPWEQRAYGISLGATWNSQLRQFIYVGEMLPQRLVDYRSTDYSLSRWLEDEINGKIRVPTKGVNKMVPRPHQITAINKIVNAGIKGSRGFIEADSTGVGKTLSSLIGVAEIAKNKGYTRERPAKLLIICPKSVIPHWKNTIKSINSDRLRIIVINYDQSKKLLEVPQAALDAKTSRTKNKRIATQGKPNIMWDYIIADEAHKLKNSEISQRSKSFSLIGRYSDLAARAPFIVWATATVGQNPLEVGYLAPLIGQIVGKKLTIGNWGQYLEQEGYNVVKGKVQYSWVSVKANQPPHQVAAIREKQKSDIKRIAEILFSPQSPSIRRLPENISGWPAIQRIDQPISLDAANMGLYNQLWTEFRSYLTLHPHGKDPKGGLAQQLRFRQKASMLRTVDTIDFVADLVENNFQVALSVAFIESLETIKNGLHKRGITTTEFSGRGLVDREQERIKFQKGHADVMLFTVTEGISLHAGELLFDGSTASMKKRATVVHDNRYSAIENNQIEGRAHRDGQKANIYYLYAQGTVEEPITKTMIQRMANMSKLSGDSDDVVSLIEKIIADGFSS